MPRVTIEEAQTALPELIHRLGPDEELLITENDAPLARLMLARSAPVRKQRRLGTMQGSVLHMSPDFDAPLDDFKEYME